MKFLPWNFLEDLAAAPVASPVFDTKYPTPNLYDRLLSRPGRFGSVTTDPFIPIDGNILKGGGFESDVELALWTDASTGGASTSRTTTAGEFNTANGSPSTSALKLTTSGAASVAKRVRERKIKLGHSVNFTVALHGDGTRVSKCRVEIPELRVCLKNDGTWSTTLQDYFTVSGAYARQQHFGVALPALPTGRGDLARKVTLRVTAYCDTASSGNAFVDDCFFWVSPSAAAILGHNIASGVTCEVHKGGAAYTEGATSLVKALTVKALTFGDEWAEITDRWLRLKFPGTNHEPIWIGEAAVGKLLEITPSAMWPIDASYTLPQSRSADGVFSYPLEDLDRRTLRPTFRRGMVETPATAYDDWRELRDTLLRSCGYGADPLIAVVPTEADPECWVYVRLPVQADVKQSEGDVWDVSPLELIEPPFPSWIP